REVLALSLAVEIVGADPDARLFQEIRERLGLGYELGAGVEHGRDWAVAVLSASAARDDERRLRETIDRTCREAAAGFQPDERRGRKLALPGGPEPTADDKPGVLDADDLLVFMACDAGEQASPAALARALAEAGADAVWRELRIEDPVEHTRGFVYLVSAAHPPASTRRYLAYAPGGD